MTTAATETERVGGRQATDYPDVDYRARAGTLHGDQPSSPPHAGIERFAWFESGALQRSRRNRPRTTAVRIAPIARTAPTATEIMATPISTNVATTNTMPMNNARSVRPSGPTFAT